MLDIAAARHELGSDYGLARPLRKTELARLAGLEPGQHGGDFIGRLESGKAVLSGPLEVVIRMLLDGHCSPRHVEAMRSRYGTPRRRGAAGATSKEGRSSFA